LAGVRQLSRHFVAGLGLTLLLAACDSGLQPAPGVVAPNEAKGFIGGAVADEPRAALVARDVLASGGTAADAAVALYFALAVTYPSAASLGGGGACLVYRPNDDGDSTEALEFPAHASTADAAGADRPSAMPGVVRGMAALHARYGALRWELLLSPAENLARFGFPISRAFAGDLGLAAAPLFADPGARTLYARADGAPIGEGEGVTALDLAGVLAQLRLKGAGEFYTGVMARRLATAVEQAGGTLDLEELRAVAPVWREAVSIQYDTEVLYTAAPPSQGGVTALRQLAALIGGDRYREAGPNERPHLAAEASLRAWRERAQESGGAPLDADRLETLLAGYDPMRHQPASELTEPFPAEPPTGTSFVVVDRAGMAVACTVSLNGLFGTGRIVPGFGFFLAAAPRGADPAASISQALLVNHNTHQVFLAAAATGGAGAATALATVLRELLIDQAALRNALAAPRLHNGAVPDRTYVEASFGTEAMDRLRERGHTIEEVPAIGRVNAISCPGGLPRSPETCAFGSDPRAAGLAVGGVF
jgi:gamma-glutamyltranspeptidase/glutathione hydrolase